MNIKTPNGEPMPQTPAERLLDDILALPDDATDGCVDSYHAIQYAKGELDADRSRDVERHGESCDTCAKFLDGIFFELRAIEKKGRLLPWLIGQIHRLGAPLRELASDLTHAATFNRNVVRRTLRLPLALPDQFRPVVNAQVFDALVPFEASTPDQRLRWRIVDEGPEVVVTFDSDVDDLIGLRSIRLRFGETVQNIVFARCAGRIVGTGVFSKIQLAAWSPADTLQLEVEALVDNSR
jgi:hypothetical protein